MVPQENHLELPPRERPGVGAVRFLVVEDERIDRVIILLDLYRHFPGCEIDSVSSGHAALELLERHGDSYDVVVLNLIMPGMKGIEVLKRMIAAHCCAGVVLFTAVGYRVPVEDLLSNEACPTLLGQCYLTSDLVRLVKNWLDGDS